MAGLVRAWGEGYARAFREGGLAALWRRWMDRWPRRISPTKTGWVFFLFLLLIALIAYATGNNLLFLLFAAMLAFFLLSGFLSEGSVGRLALRIEWPREWMAREAAPVGLRLRHTGRGLGAYLLEVRHPDLAASAETPRLIHLPAGSEALRTISLRAPRRGRYRPAPFVFATSYPFLLLTKTRAFRVDQETLIYPAWRQIEDAPVWLASGLGHDRAHLGAEGDVDHLREWREGEALRRIHWKKSAGLAPRLFVKELATPRGLRLALRFVPGAADDFEAGIERAASWAVYLSERGVPFALGLDAQADYTRFSDREEALRALALYDSPQIPPEAPPEYAQITVSADGSETLRRALGEGGER